MYSILALVGRSNGLSFVLMGGTACCNPTQRVLLHSQIKERFLLKKNKNNLKSML